jgi:hypothetical protein
VHPLYGLEVVFYCWLLAGQRFEVGVGGGRKRLNILGAYCPDDQEYYLSRHFLAVLGPVDITLLLITMGYSHRRRLDTPGAGRRSPKGRTRKTQGLR